MTDRTSAGFAAVAAWERARAAYNAAHEITDPIRREAARAGAEEDGRHALRDYRDAVAAFTPRAS